MRLVPSDKDAREDHREQSADDTEQIVEEIQAAHRAAETVESRVVGRQLAAVVNNPKRALVELTINSVFSGGDGSVE